MLDMLWYGRAESSTAVYGNGIAERGSTKYMRRYGKAEFCMVKKG